jgi:hypothetical protein
MAKMKGKSMHSGLRILLSIVIVASVGCTSSAPTPPSAPSNTRGENRITWLTATGSQAAAGGPRTSAVIDGFRVHPDPGDDGVIHVSADVSVAVNATDIASRPPAAQSYLVVNWGDGPNQRVACGPCRADHSYAPGRYTLVASADNLPSSSGSDRSISVVVQVSPARDKSVAVSVPGPIQPFQLSSGDIAVGETTFLLVPIALPSGVAVGFSSLDCTPPGAGFADFASVVFIPPNAALPFVGLAPGTCTFSVFGTDGGAPFVQSATFTIH